MEERMKVKPFNAAILLAGSIACSQAVPETPAIDAETHETLRAMSGASTWGHPDQFGPVCRHATLCQRNYQDALIYFKIGPAMPIGSPN